MNIKIIALIATAIGAVGVAIKAAANTHKKRTEQEKMEAEMESEMEAKRENEHHEKLKKLKYIEYANELLSSIYNSEQNIIQLIGDFYDKIKIKYSFTDKVIKILYSDEDICQNTLDHLKEYNELLSQNLNTINKNTMPFLEEYAKFKNSSWSNWDNHLKMQYRDIAIYFDNLTDNFLKSNIDLSQLKNKITNLKTLQEHYD